MSTSSESRRIYSRLQAICDYFWKTLQHEKDPIELCQALRICAIAFGRLELQVKIRYSDTTAVASFENTIAISFRKAIQKALKLKSLILQQSSLFHEDSASSDEDFDSSDEESAPSEEDAVPSEEDAVPSEEDAVPSEKDAIPGDNQPPDWVESGIKGLTFATAVLALHKKKPRDGHRFFACVKTSNVVNYLDKALRSVQIAQDDYPRLAASMNNRIEKLINDPDNEMDAKKVAAELLVMFTNLRNAARDQNKPSNFTKCADSKLLSLQRGDDSDIEFTERDDELKRRSFHTSRWLQTVWEVLGFVFGENLPELADRLISQTKLNATRLWIHFCGFCYERNKKENPNLVEAWKKTLEFAATVAYAYFLGSAAIATLQYLLKDASPETRNKVLFGHVRCNGKRRHLITTEMHTSCFIIEELLPKSARLMYKSYDECSCDEDPDAAKFVRVEGGVFPHPVWLSDVMGNPYKESEDPEARCNEFMRRHLLYNSYNDIYAIFRHQ